MLGSLIQAHAAAAANAGDWAAVAGILNAATVAKTSRGTKTPMARVLSVLTDNERDPTLAAFSTTEVGRDGRTMLAAQGLDFAHPLTIGLITQLSNAFPTGVAAKLLALGNWYVSYAADAGMADVTADQCRDAWKAEQLRARLINAAALATERISVTDTPEQQAAKWATAWAEAV